MPVDWARTQTNLAVKYLIRIRGDRANNIEKAIRCCESALEVRTREAMPVQWAETTMNLAVAYYDRIREDRSDNIEEAIRCYERILEVRTRNAMPVEWAQTMNNLATAYSDRIRGDRAENMEEAIRRHRRALEVITRETMPMEWASTIMNLATEYSERIRGDRADNIEEAIRCYDQALEVLHAMPSEHRQAQLNLSALCFNERRWTMAVKAFGGLLESNEVLYKAAALPESRQAELWESRGIAARMAYALVNSETPGALRKSVEVLERSRARWLSEALALGSGKPESIPNESWNDFERRRTFYNELLAESRLPEDTPGRRTFLEV